MSGHYSHFIEVANGTTQPERPRALQVLSGEPPERFRRSSLRLIRVARWNGLGYEFHGDPQRDHRGIYNGQFLFIWDGAGAGNLPLESRFFPFTPLKKRPGEFVAISQVRSNPWLDTLSFSPAGDEVTLQRLHAYHPREPQFTRFRRTTGVVPAGISG